MAAPKRRLPVLNTSGPQPDDEPPRPPWHWVGFGVVLVFAASVPLVWIAELVKRRTLAGLLGTVTDAADVERAMAALPARSRAAVVFVTVGLPALALTAGAYAAGYVVGKFGAGTTAREAGLAGVLAALLATILAWLSAGFSLAPLVSCLLLGGAAWLGGRSGARIKR